MKANRADDDESLLWRPPAPKPYVPSELVLTVPLGALELTVRVFQAYAPHRVESSCFWYGTRDGAGNGRVLAVAVPRQFNHWGRYHVEPDAFAAVSAATRSQGWKNLSQIHTHPGRAIEHSRYDDAQANSRRALSVVFPLYGLWAGAWPQGVGVHEFQNDYWHLLSAEHAAMRIVIDTADATRCLVDTRR